MLMETQSNKILNIKHISAATTECIEYIQDRQTKKITSLATRWNKFNRLCMGGIEPNAIYTIAGISGSGKSSFVNTLETDLIDINPNHDIVILSFNFEMLSSRQVGRKLSYKMKKTTSELYSASEIISNEEVEEIKNVAKNISKYPIYYVDSPGTVEEIENTIKYFQNNIAKDKWLIVILDHLLLARSSSGDSERIVISDLQKVFMQAKKIGKTSIIQISQMNRNIEESDRIKNPSLHYPMRSDLSTSDSIFQASDYVIVIHRPEILGISEYGAKHLPVKDMVYMHFLKNREGDVKILKFINDLKYNNLREPTPEDEQRQSNEPLKLNF
nr:MAG TPA: Helicase, ATPase, REPLICATION [Caudoviricetes sp.]